MYRTPRPSQWLAAATSVTPAGILAAGALSPASR